MIAFDTNVVVRLIVRDDASQVEHARRLLEDGHVYLSLPCLMETAWVLNASYGLSAADIEIALVALLDATDLILDVPHLVRWCLSRAAEGADFADMILLAAARDCQRFVTFDRGIRRHAVGSPVEVELLA